MDGVSSAAAIIGVAAAARGIFAEISKLSHANEALADLDALLRDFSDSCDAVWGVLRGLPRATEDEIARWDPRPWRGFTRSLTELRNRIGRLQELAHSLRGAGRTVAAVRLRWNEQTIADARAMIQGMQPSVSMMLLLLNT